MTWRRSTCRNCALCLTFPLSSRSSRASSSENQGEVMGYFVSFWKHSMNGKSAGILLQSLILLIARGNKSWLWNSRSAAAPSTDLVIGAHQRRGKHICHLATQIGVSSSRALEQARETGVRTPLVG
jgi:hypothetical protein